MITERNGTITINETPVLKAFTTINTPPCLEELGNDSKNLDKLTALGKCPCPNPCPCPCPCQCMCPSPRPR